MKAKRVLSPETRVEGGCLVRSEEARKKTSRGGRECFVLVEEYIIHHPHPVPYVSEQKVRCVINGCGIKRYFLKNRKMKEKLPYPSGIKPNNI
jgi:hypothetical protein